MRFIYRFFEKIEKIYNPYLITAIFFIAFLIYGGSLFNNFVWDDEEQIVANSIIKHVSNIPYLFTGSTFNTGGAGLGGFYYKPLMPLSFSLNYALWELNPFGYHFFSLFMHTINSILIFFLFKKLFSLLKFAFSKTLAFLLSVLFLVHPANTEAVAYISSTQEVLYVFFLLLALLSTITFCQKPKTSIKNLIFINLCFLFSLLSKESGIVSLPLAVLLVFLFCRKKILMFAFCSSLTFVFYLFLRFVIAKMPFTHHTTDAKIIPIAAASFLERLQTIPYELFSYIRLFFFPKDLFVAQHTVIKSVDFVFYLNLFVVLVILLLLIIFALKLKSKLYLFFFLWIIFSFSILLNIYSLDMTIAERWLYGPMIGILGIIGILIIFSPNFLRKGLFFILFLAIVFFSLRTFQRTFDWKDNFSLFSHDLKYSKDSFDLQNNLGVAYFRKNLPKQAKKYFEKSIKLCPQWWTPYNNLGVIYEREGNFEKAKFLYQKAIENGDYYLAYENLAQLKVKTEKPEDVIPFLKDALLRLPYNEILHRTLALVYYKEKDFEKAKFYAEKAYSLNSSQENYFLIQKIVGRE